MAAEPTAITNTPAPDAQAPASPAVQAIANPAPTAGDDSSALRAQVDALLKWKDSAEADLKKGRDAKKAAEEKAAAERAEAEKKAREAGDLAALHEMERAKREGLEARLADLAPKAEKHTAYETRALAKIDAAIKAGDLPSHVVRSITVASKVDVSEALDILDEFRASIGTGPAPKQPAPPAPPQGAAPASPPATKRLEDLTTAEIHQLKAEGKLNELLGKSADAGKRPSAFQRFFA